MAAIRDKVVYTVGQIVGNPVVPNAILETSHGRTQRFARTNCLYPATTRKLLYMSIPVLEQRHTSRIYPPTFFNVHTFYITYDRYSLSN